MSPTRPVALGLAGLALLGLGFVLGGDAPAHRRVSSPDLPIRPGAPYSQAVMAGDILFLSGNTGVDPRTGKLPAAFAEQAAQALRNQETLLRAAGLGWEDVVKVNVYVEDLSRYDEFNRIYVAMLPAPLPARTFLAVADVPFSSEIEIEAVAVRRR